jgi:hypothetical protein
VQPGRNVIHYRPERVEGVNHHEYDHLARDVRRLGNQSEQRPVRKGYAVLYGRNDVHCDPERVEGAGRHGYDHHARDTSRLGDQKKQSPERESYAVLSGRLREWKALTPSLLSRVGIVAAGRASGHPVAG